MCVYIYMYIYMYRSPAFSLGSGEEKRGLAFTRCCYDQYCMVYCIPKGGRGRVVYCPMAVQ